MPKKQEAFTLLEFMLYAGIVAVLLFATTEVILSLLDGKAKIDAIQEINQNERLVMRMMSQAIRSANSVTTPAQGATSSILVLQTDSTTTSPTIFSVVDQTLQVKEGNAATTTLTSSGVRISSLEFRNLASTGTPANIRINLSVSSENPTNDSDYDASDSIEGAASVRRKL
ncbi:MAG: hypothetical protein RDU25_00855 [Patescibacteria group bacterium]|nr:hypothetical protein [Patescibacteria group bacterium]